MGCIRNYNTLRLFFKGQAWGIGRDALLGHNSRHLAAGRRNNHPKRMEQQVWVAAALDLGTCWIWTSGFCTWNCGTCPQAFDLLAWRQYIFSPCKSSSHPTASYSDLRSSYLCPAFGPDPYLPQLVEAKGVWDGTAQWIREGAEPCQRIGVCLTGGGLPAKGPLTTKFYIWFAFHV